MCPPLGWTPGPHTSPVEVCGVGSSRSSKWGSKGNPSERVAKKRAEWVGMASWGLSSCGTAHLSGAPVCLTALLPHLCPCCFLLVIYNSCSKYLNTSYAPSRCLPSCPHLLLPKAFYSATSSTTPKTMFYKLGSLFPGQITTEAHQHSLLNISYTSRFSCYLCCYQHCSGHSTSHLNEAKEQGLWRHTA